MVRPTTIKDVCEAVREHSCVLPCGGGTKPALSATAEGVTRLELGGLRGIIEYEPDEYTFTALAGTPLAEVQAALAMHGQYLPFDPPLAAAGATLGGTVAAGLSGPGRLRYGGVRDFVIGVRWVDGTGELIRGGGKVVKNAAGFDFPKLFCGSLGRLGVMADLSFKVFPSPTARVTTAIECSSTGDAVDRLNFLAGQSWEAEALEFCGVDKPVLYARFMGDEPALTPRVEAVLAAVQRPGRILSSGEADAYWKECAALAGEPLVKVPLTPGRIPSLEYELAGTQGSRRYSMAGNVAYLSGIDPATLHPVLRARQLPGLTLRGGGPLRPGFISSALMEAKVKASMDPHGKFPPLLSEPYNPAPSA